MSRSASALDAVGVRSAHVYGVSMGGMVAQEFAIRFPQRVRGLILAGTSPGGPLAARPSARRVAAVASGVGRPLALSGGKLRTGSGAVVGIHRTRDRIRTANQRSDP